MNRIAGNTTSANALALSQENSRFLSCHGQINRKSLPPPRFESNFFSQLPFGSCRRVYGRRAARSRRGLEARRPWRRSSRIETMAAIQAALELDHRATRQCDLAGDADRASLRQMERRVLLVVDTLGRRAVDRNDDLVA